MHDQPAADAWRLKSASFMHRQPPMELCRETAGSTSQGDDRLVVRAQRSLTTVCVLTQAGGGHEESDDDSEWTEDEEVATPVCPLPSRAKY